MTWSGHVVQKDWIKCCTMMETERRIINYRVKEDMKTFSLFQKQPQFTSAERTARRQLSKPGSPA